MISKNPHMLNDAAEMFSDSAKHLFVIYMLFVMYYSIYVILSIL